MEQYIALYSLPFNSFHPHYSCNYMYMDYYLFANHGGMEGWVGLVDWHILSSSSAASSNSPVVSLDHSVTFSDHVHPQNWQCDNEWVTARFFLVDCQPVTSTVGWVLHHQQGWPTPTLADPQWTVYPQCDHLSTVDQMQDRESLTAKDRRSNHCAMLPNHVHKD